MNIIIFNLCSIRVVLCANFVSDLRSIPSTKLESSKSRLLRAELYAFTDELATSHIVS
jgi:hypothetical protein